MVQRGIGQPDEADAPVLPRFEIQESSYSLAPVASDIENESEDEGADEVPKVSPRVRRVRAAALFASIVAPVFLLGLYEAVTIGTEEFGGVVPAAQQGLVAAESWGRSLAAGQSEARIMAGERENVLTDDEARDVAAARLEQVTEVARVACADEGMTPTALWVIATVTEDGAVASIAVEGPTHGRPHVATCVGGIARNMHIPKFRGPPVTAGREITIR